MNARTQNRYFNYRFDFEIGCLIKSPCKECRRREQFPGCIDRCRILERIHTLLAESVSCTNRKV